MCTMFLKCMLLPCNVAQRTKLHDVLHIADVPNIHQAKSRHQNLFLKKGPRRTSYMDQFNTLDMLDTIAIALFPKSNCHKTWEDYSVPWPGTL